MSQTGTVSSLHDLALRFESLGGGSVRGGGGYGCEFGFFQRGCGADPIGLLRWSSIWPAHLIEALRTRFTGLLDPRRIGLAQQTGWPEWKIYGGAYQLQMDHSGLNPAKISHDDAHAIICRRFGFLVRKLIEDLEAGNKLFVYRIADGDLEPEQLSELAAAVNAYGNNTLLYVQKTPDRAFSVERIHPGLMIGYIDRFAPGKDRIQFNPEGWEAVCRAALAA